MNNGRRGVESRHVAVHKESRSTFECAGKGSAAIAPSVTYGPHREDASRSNALPPPTTKKMSNLLHSQTEKLQNTTEGTLS